MKNQIKTRLSTLRNRMVFRLWAFMMIPVMFGICFMWVVQIFLFEQNYANASVNEALEHLAPVMEDLRTRDIAEDERLLSFISHVSGELLLVSEDGTLIKMYSSGHLVQPREWERKLKAPDSDALSQNSGFEELSQGHPYQHIERFHGQIIGYELGFPVTYNGDSDYLILRNALMTRTVLNLNRSQLIVLSILLTGIASVLAAVLSKQFTKPIFQIKESVDKLTQNDFSIEPDLERQDELGQLSHSVGKLRQALQRLDVLRREVIANVSHELRSPLALITGYAEMVRDITWKDEAMRNENLNLIISESNRMSEMVNDILDYSQFSAGYSKLKKGWYDLRDIVNAELTRCRQAAAEHGITLTLQIADAQTSDAPAQGTESANTPETLTQDSASTDMPDANSQAAGQMQFQVDALKMSQVMRNLLNNAINHTPENQEIFIRLTPDPSACPESPAGTQTCSRDTASPCCLVEVANPGDPIPEEDREIIWERYQRSQHQSGRRLGTGIGLSIVSTILKAHDMPYGVDCKDGYNIFWFLCR